MSPRVDWRAEFDEYATGWLLEQDELHVRERDFDELHGIDNQDRRPGAERVVWCEADELYERSRDARIWEDDWTDHT